MRVEVYDNKGRDVVPFLTQIRPVADKYEYICHLHTKKSKHDVIGDNWRHHLYVNLLGSREIVEDILFMMESDHSIGVVFPETFFAVKPFAGWGINRETAQRFSNMIGVEIPQEDLGAGNNLIFPAGNMFWAKTAAVRQILEYDFGDVEIPPEEGQLDGTIMHAIERMWGCVAKYNGFRTVMTYNPFHDTGKDYYNAQQGSGKQDIVLQSNSHMWKVVTKYYYLRDKILPSGSKRRRIAKKLFTTLKKVKLFLVRK